MARAARIPNGRTFPAISRSEKKQTELFLVGLGAGLGALLGGPIAGVGGAAVGGALGIAGALALIYTQDEP